MAALTLSFRRQRADRITWVHAGLVLSPLLTGCAHIYSPTEHQLATSAQSAFADTRLSEALRGERVVLDSTLARELAVVRRMGMAQRDLRLREVVGRSDDTSWLRLTRMIDAGIERLVGAANPYPMVVVAAQLPEFQRQLESQNDSYRLEKAANDPELTCPLNDGTPPASITARPFFNSYKGVCTAYLTQRGLIAAQGELGATITAIGKLAIADSAQKAAMKALNSAYDAAKKAYSAGIAARDASVVEKAASELKKQLSGLDDLQSSAAPIDEQFADLNLTGRISALEKRKESVDRVLAALLAGSAGATNVPDSTLADLAILKWIPALERRISATDFPETSALLLERESLRLRLDAATRSHEAALHRVSLLGSKRDLLLAELTSLTQAKSALDGILKAPAGNRICVAVVSLYEAFEKGTAKCREQVARALLSYANSWTLGRIPADEVDYRLIAAQHATVVDASENALAQWESLIKIPIDQLLAYHASGIKSQDIAALLNALGLGALAATR